MSDDVAVVWVAEPEAREDAEHALEAWARPRELRLTRPTATIDDAAAAADARADVARALEEAREAISALDTVHTTRALTRAEARVAASDELPEAAWLMAEIRRAWATRWTRLEPRDEARAAEAWRAASALDGGRVAGVGEHAAPDLVATRQVRVRVRGALPRRATLRVDSEPVAVRRVADALEGEVALAGDMHHLYVDLDGRRLASGWAVVRAGDLELDVGDAARCDARELGRARVEGDTVVVRGVACPRWIAVVPEGTAGGLRIARCEEDACGALLPWRVLRPSPHDPVAPPPARWPGWATWALAGVLAGAATTAGVVASGVLESRPATPRFVGGGVRLE